MARALWVSMAFVCLSGTVASSAPWTKWQNSLKPGGKPAPALALAAGGKTDYRIIVGASASSEELKAAEDLALWLKEITGAVFPIRKDSEPVKKKEISIGKTNRLVETKGIAGQDLGGEGYTIAVRGQTLYLLGGTGRGPINAVYALLEEDLGCRWYAGSSSRIPKAPSLKTAVATRTIVPALEIRDPFYRVAFDGTWSLRNRTNAPSAVVPEKWGGNVDYALFVHTVHSLVPPSEYFDKHPEYFMMDGSGNRITQQLCMTNPEVVRIATESVLKTLKEHPYSEIISVSKMDGGGSCVCPNCKALDDAEGTNAASLLFFVNKIAEVVEKEYPKAVVDTLAYLETVGPPKTIRPRKNVAIRLCTDNCMWSHPFTPAREIEAFDQALKGWAAIHDRIHIWDYCVNFSHYTAPMPNMHAIADNIRYFSRNHLRGIMEQGAYQSPGSERDLLRSWVFAKLMWDPTLDMDALTQDFIWGYFGKAAPAIAEYNALLEAAGRQHAEALKNPPGGIRYPMDTVFLSKEFLDRASALYDRAEKLAENDEIRARVEQDRIPILYVLLSRGLEFVGPSYPDLIERFEKTARAVGLTHIAEGPPDVEARIRSWKDAWRAAQEGKP
ncbi:MAG: DUF4838 domain-containing protein [Armatimonadetes bacterium]|nr:DUF4838 domain-containing protein [Armatimonadota bacterium]